MVVHSGEFNPQECLFKQIIVPKTKVGPFLIQRNRPDFSQFDVVVSMFDLHWLSNIWPVFFKKNVKFLFWGHGFGKNKLGNKIRKWLIHKSDGLILYNEQRKKELAQAGISVDKLYVANNTIAVTNAGRAETVKNQFLFVGRLQQRKRVDILIRAFALAKNQLADNSVFLSIVGDGEERQSLEQLSRELAVEPYCTFHGALNDDEMLKRQFEKSFAYVSPGAMGLGINHAFAYGIPTLSNKSVKHGPESWVLNEKNSLWIDAQADDDQVSLLAKQMISLATNGALAESLSKQAYKDYEQFCSMEVMANGFCHVFEQ